MRLKPQAALQGQRTAEPLNRKKKERKNLRKKEST